MNYRVLGKTAIKVSEIGYGCGNVGGLMIRGSEDEQVRAVQRAIELGVNYFDTAVLYGNGQSESNLGKVMSVLKPDVTVATKFSINREDLRDIKGAIQTSLEGSLQRLQMDSVDILQLHTPVISERDSSLQRWGVTVSEVLDRNGIADSLDSLRSQGFFRYIGFTGIGDTDAVHHVIESNRFDIVQSYYNLLNPSSGITVPAGFKGQDFRRLIDSANKQDMGVVVIRVMAGGALGGKAARTGHASPAIGGSLVNGSEYEADEKKAGKLGFLVAGDITGLPQAAIKFALMHRGVSTVLVGYSNIDQIEEAAGCSDKHDIPNDSFEKLKVLWSTNFDI